MYVLSLVFAFVSELRGGVTRALFGLALLNKNQLLSFEGFLMRMND
jgi:hypothetical protein